MAQNVNLATGKIEVLIGHPTDMATQTWANARFAFDSDVQNLSTSISTSLANKAETTHWYLA